MQINNELIEYVAKLAKLALSEEEKQGRAKDLNEILAYAELLSGIDTTEIEPMSHAFDMKNVMREDVPAQDFSREDLLKNAPQKKGGYFIVPKTVE